MSFLSDSKQTVHKGGLQVLLDRNSDLTGPTVQPVQAPHRHGKKIFCVKVLVPVAIFILIVLGILIALLYSQTSSLSQQIAALQTQNTNLKAQLTALQNSVQSEVSALNQSFISLGQNVTANMTQLKNSLLNTQVEVSSLNQNLIALEASVDSLDTFVNPLLLNYTYMGAYQYTVPCQGESFLVPGIEFSFSSKNGGYGICDFAMGSEWNYGALVWSSLTLDGSPFPFLSSLWNGYTAPYYYATHTWGQNFEFSGGNHTLTVTTKVKNTTCAASSYSVILTDPRLMCTLYGAEDNS